MLSPTPAVRAAVLGLIVVTVVAVAGAGLHLRSAQRDARQAQAQVLRTHAATLAATFAPLDPTPRSLRQAVARYRSLGGPAQIVLMDAAGAILAFTGETVPQEVDWAALAGLGPEGARIVSVGAQPYGVAVAQVGAPGLLVAALAPVPGLPTRTLVETVCGALALWGALAVLLLVVAWYTGPQTATQLALLGERIAQGDTDGSALVRHAGIWLGPLADAFEPVVGKIRQMGAEAADTRDHVAALYQINPHYVVLCSFDGHVVEANPAFYAATGLPIQAVRGGRIEALRETFPIEPLMDLAERSLTEGSAISGLEYGLINRDDETRPVEVSLRAFSLAGERMVLIQATDVAHAKTLERRVAAFTDTLDLMVDQRVQQLTSGQQALTKILDTAGVAIASFDAGGATSRWNGGARSLTGKPAASVPHFAAASAVLGLSPTERTAFTRWFWSPASDPFVARHGVVGADGATRVRQFIWQRVDADMAGRSDLRTLVGVEVPAYLDVLATGDGRARGLPIPA